MMYVVMMNVIRMNMITMNVITMHVITMNVITMNVITMNICDYDDNYEKNVNFCSSLISISINISVMIGRTIKM